MHEIMFENGKYYERVYSGMEQKGYEYMGNKEINPIYEPSKWCPLQGNVYTFTDINEFSTLIYRKEIPASDILFENGKSYYRVYSGMEQDGDEFMGNKDKWDGYEPDNWTSIKDRPDSDKRYRIEGETTLIYRRPVSITNVTSNVDIDEPLVKKEPLPLRSYSIADLMEWRNTASSRVDRIDDDLKYIDICIKEYEMKRSKLMKKRHKDCKWIHQLNRALKDIVIKKR